MRIQEKINTISTCARFILGSDMRVERIPVERFHAGYAREPHAGYAREPHSAFLPRAHTVSYVVGGRVGVGGAL